MDLYNKKFLVYGTGTSGLSAYKFLLGKGANVKIYSDKYEESNQDLNIIKNFSDVLKQAFDYVVLSPGVNIVGNKNIKKMRSKGWLLMSELELGYLFCKGKFIAVTGTNGKTTCVNLINHILSKKYKTFLCGNVGTPITSICENTTQDCVVVCEVSSFMLEIISPNFKPDISVILNITPDHLARHKTFDAYIKIKNKITEFQDKNDYVVLPEELLNLSTNAKKIIAEQEKFKTKLIGDFNQLNISFCYKVCQLLNVSKKEFVQSLKTFSPVSFRLQKLGKKKGITYINDSKATNPDSTVKALSAMDKSVVLLLGGSDKGSNFREVFALKDKIKVALIYGQTAPVLESDAIAMGVNNIARFDNLYQTLQHLKEFTKRGDIVLFSPACASYDEFKNYIQRGEFFNNYFNNI